MRSKTLLISNILATIYAGILIWWIGGGIIEAGGIDYIEFVVKSFSILSDLSGGSSETVAFVYTIIALLIAHIILFAFGALFGWIGYLSKKSGTAKFAATLYLVGTICFPIYIMYGLPITIIGFVGGSNQKKLNKEVISA